MRQLLLGIFIGLLLGMLVGALAHAQQKTFPMGKAMPINNNYACMKKEDAISVAKAKDAGDGFEIEIRMQLEGKCGVGQGTVTYTNLVWEGKTWRVYSFTAFGGRVTWHEVTDWKAESI